MRTKRYLRALVLARASAHIFTRTTHDPPSKQHRKAEAAKVRRTNRLTARQKENRQHVTKSASQPNDQRDHFIAEDPIGLEGGINMYAFASGDPINRSDPSGLSDNGFTDCYFLQWVKWPGNPDPVYTWEKGYCPSQPVGHGLPGDQGAGAGGGPTSGPTGQTTGGGNTPGNPMAAIQQKTCPVSLTPLELAAGKNALSRANKRFEERSTAIVGGRVVPVKPIWASAVKVTAVIPKGATFYTHAHLWFGSSDHNYGSLSSGDTAVANAMSPFIPFMAFSKDSFSIIRQRNGPIITCGR